MFAETTKKAALRLTALLLLAAVLLTACSTGAQKKIDQLELGRKYLTEMNYTEAIAAFTEAIRLNPDDIQAYLGRAQAYEALGKYEEAKDDYTTVIEKADDLPYTQAQAYVGRAEINETLDEPVSVESDYSKALTLLERDDVGTAEKIAAATITALTIKVLYQHVESCIRLQQRDKALTDYDKLEQLGEDVSNARDTLDAVLKKEENSVETPADTDAGQTPAEEDASADLEEPASSKPDEAGQKEQPAASASSKQQKETPASSTEQKPAVEPEKSYTETSSGTYDGYLDGAVVKHTSKLTVTYQVGGQKLRVEKDYDAQYVYADGTIQPIEEDGYTMHTTRQNSYTLSNAVQSVERVGKNHLIVYVPAGTVIQVTETCNSTSSDEGRNELWLCTLDDVSTEADRKAECANDTTPWEDSRLTNNDTSVTIQKDQMCKVFAYDFFSPRRAMGGITFCGV